jgi:pimeloyl-ACP methyl ester carboxylesterase
MNPPDASVHVVPSITSPERLGQRDCTLSDGRTVAYAVAGDPDGPPVLVHHGTPGCRLFASLLADAACDVGVRLLVPDRPGYGRSSPPPTDWTWRDWRRDCDELLAAESVDSAASLGFSGGGPFAIATAASDRTTRVGLVSALVPPFEGGLATLARLPFALRLLFGLTDVVAQFGRPGLVVGQYTDRDVTASVAAAVAAEFHEALAQDARAPARENRLFAARRLDSRPAVPLRAWHGTRDENTPLAPLQTFVRAAAGTVTTHDADHLGTLLDCRREALSWLAAGGRDAP